MAGPWRKICASIVLCLAAALSHSGAAPSETDLQSDDFTLCLELPVQVHQRKLRYTEILSEERERYAGKTKVNALIDGLKILRGIFSIKR